MSQINSSTPPSTRGFLFGRLGSALAVVPLGVWVINHLWNNLGVFQGPSAWQHAVTEYPHPVAEAVTGILVLFPLLFHTLWGITRLFSSRPNLRRYHHYGNLKYVLQRLSAVGVLFFIGAHLWLALLEPRLVQGHAELFADFAHAMRFHRPTLGVYLLGTLGVSYHLANGVQMAGFSWGILASRRAIRNFEVVAIALFAILLAISWAILYGFWVAGSA